MHSCIKTKHASNHASPPTNFSSLQVYTKHSRARSARSSASTVSRSPTVSGSKVPIRHTEMANITMDDIRALMEQVTKNIEDNLGARMAALEEKLNKQPEPEPEYEEEESDNGSQDDPNVALTKKLLEKIETLEKFVTALRTHKEVVDVDSLSLFPKARLPAKFHMPNMDKFDGTTCPKTHLKMYVGALNPLGLNNELLAQLFQQSLTGPALKWFMSLDL